MNTGRKIVQEELEQKLDKLLPHQVHQQQLYLRALPKAQIPRMLSASMEIRRSSRKRTVCPQWLEEYEAIS